MRRSSAFFLVVLLGLGCLAGSKKTPEVTIRFYGEVAAVNGTSFATEVPLLDGSGKIWMSKVATVSEKDITEFMPFQNADGTIGAYFFLDEHGKLLLETQSIEQRGKIMVAVVNGRHVVDLLMDKRNSDGIAAIPTGLTPQDLDAIRKKIRIREATKPAASPASAR